MHMYIKKRNEKTQSISMTCILSRKKGRWNVSDPFIFFFKTLNFVWNSKIHILSFKWSRLFPYSHELFVT